VIQSKRCSGDLQITCVIFCEKSPILVRHASTCLLSHLIDSQMFEKYEEKFSAKLFMKKWLRRTKKLVSVN
jgi:hypothetical protein